MNVSLKKKSGESKRKAKTLQMFSFYTEIKNIDFMLMSFSYIHCHAALTLMMVFTEDSIRFVCPFFFLLFFFFFFFFFFAQDNTPILFAGQ